MNKLLKWSPSLILALIIVLLIWAIFNNRDRHPGYKADLSITTTSREAHYSAGFAKRPITPTVTDTWNDTNGNARYDKGETYNDNNNNGKFGSRLLPRWQVSGLGQPLF